MQSIVRYILDHDRARENIVMYTRWMNSHELARWKRKYLFTVPPIYASFKFWEKQMYDEHFGIVASLADGLFNEASGDNIKEDAQKWKINYSRITVQVSYEGLDD